jgi:integrase/recombinase XerD
MQSRSIPSVTLYIRITDEKGNRRYERVNRRKPQLNGGVYCLHFYEGGKRKWTTVGTDINAALKARMEKESQLLTQPLDAKPSPSAPKPLEQLRTAFIHDKSTTIKKDGTRLDDDTLSSYARVTREFLDTIKRTMPSDITKQDLKDWMLKLRVGDEKHTAVSHNTVCNYYISIACFLHFCGVDHKKLLPHSERPSPAEETPEAYTQEEMTNFFFVITNERDALAFELLLKTGPREREMTNLEWKHLNLGPTPTVSYTTRENFRTKTGKSRTVPLERGLAQKLIAWRAKNLSARFVFPTDEGKVEGHFLRICKAVALRSGQDPSNFWLHKFRDTFATWALRRGVDIRTVQHWLGHASIEMTQRYLAPEQGEHAQTQINRAFSEALADCAT